MTENPLPRSVSHAVAHQLAEQVLRQTGELFLPASGRSMVPAIWPGDAVIVEPASAEDVAAGDIVLFSSACRFVAHRVVKSDDNGSGLVLTRGDAMAAADSPIRQNEILGRVSFVVRDGQCFRAKKKLRWSQRALAALLRRSETAARVVVGVHGLGRASSKAV